MSLRPERFNRVYHFGQGNYWKESTEDVRLLIAETTFVYLHAEYNLTIWHEDLWKVFAHVVRIRE